LEGSYRKRSGHGRHRDHVSRRQARRCSGRRLCRSHGSAGRRRREGTAVAPFDLFLAALGTCTGLYVLAFCQARGISTDGLSLRQRVEINPATKLPNGIRIEVRLPSSFPEKYRTAVLRAAEGCKVKKTIAAAPSVDVALAPADEPLVNAS
jgi:putative redox protein